ncbi:hypothetical protein IL252_13920 (plasmid) [Halomicrobium sp. IBSBa]|uniref:DUF6498-containing protein n=1 Tax=Halomicrobium sp. IBSBa TaxID=2778916 RepID=UPI001ABEF94A|nr:DUF6498-containing protein [Halomicrobium sp. IBSBa]MBO4248914.1 hypothetical protein [Halomicrobium sp. IBSBa]
MPSTSSERLPTAAGFVPVVLANLVPLVGVVRLGWEPETLVVVYTLEVLFAFPLAGVKALFAQQPPRTDHEGSTVVSVSDELTRKRGSVTVVPWLPPVYPRNVPFALAVGGVAAWFGMAIGVVVSRPIPVAAVVSQPEVLLSVGTLVVGQTVETWRDLRDGHHETTTPYAVIETPARQAFFLAFVLFVVPVTAVAGTAATLGVFVVVKLLVEWSGYRATHGDGGRLTGWLSGPDESGRTPAVDDVPAGEPDARVRTDGRAVLSTGALQALSERAPVYATSFVIVWLFSLVILGGEEPSRAVALGSGLVLVCLFVALLAARVGTFYLRYGTLEYRRYDDRLVAYDSLLDEPQWWASIGSLRDAEVVSDRLPDRLLGTRTISLAAGWGDDPRRSLGPVADAEALVRAFDLHVRTTALAPIDRRVAAVVAGCVGVIVLAPVAVVLVPALSSSTALLYGVFVLPFATLPLRGLWKRAYPEESTAAESDV